ncbi:glyoxylate/hydroxypyruvate reductase HPR3-like isoform X1 [Phragmites australis]|uniref:glyoxylate/hydroxypyruvate reductase HPR3-like isoform X1 n=1 Tax=Phragmites australis TaxID=29695 RepID=UPI002D77B0B2|nr:glyoxylate/hydroxypyruvate reductase HPR3-like isoform X1 [Phragmites australis]
MESAAAASGERPILPALLLIRRLDETFAAELRQRFRVLDFYASGEALPAFLAAAATVPDPPRAAVVMGGGAARVDASFLDAVPSLRFVFSTGAGVDHIDLDECARRGVAVANSGRVYSADVADHAVGMLIDVLRRVSAAERFVRRGLWPVRGDYPLGSKLCGKRVGIIGLGNIGSLIAKRLEAFGCVIYYNSRRPKDSISYKYFPNVQDLASESDVLVVACALNKETMHIVNKDVLEALGKDGVIINIGRGRNIDEVELVRALLDGTIAGAGLDVFENEPKVPAELLSMDNVVLTHHVAVFTSESRSDLRNITIGNLEAFFSGKPLLTPVLP